MNILIESFIQFVAFIFIYWLLVIRHENKNIRTSCTCGQEKKYCKSYLRENNRGLRVINRWKCKKNVEKFTKLKESDEIKRIRKEIKNNGESIL